MAVDADARARKLTLVACILGSAIVFVDSTVINVALPALRADLGATLADQQWVVEAYLLTLGSLVLVGGSLGDLLGRRRVFAIGTAAFGVLSLACALAPSPPILIALRALQGIAGALLVPSSLAIIAAMFEGPARGAAIGTWTAATSAAIAVGPPLGGLLVDAVSWRLIFALNVPLVAVALVLVARAMPPLPGRPNARVDVLGAGLCASGLAGIVFGLVEQPTKLWAIVAGAVVLCAFVAWEMHTDEPMLPLGMFRVRNFAVTNAATLAVYAGLGAATFFVTLFLQQVGGYSALEAGAALTPITLMLIALSRRWGELAARIGPRLLMGLGPVVAAAGLALFLRVDARADYVAQVLPATLVFGLGLSMTVAPLTATALDAVDPDRAGVASGVNNAVARIAGLLAIAAVGAVVAAQFGSTLDRQLAGQRLDPGQRALVQRARRRPLVEEVHGAGPALRRATERASVSAFHAGMAVSAVLVLAGGIVALAGIANPPRARRAGAARAGVASGEGAASPPAGERGT